MMTWHERQLAEEAYMRWSYEMEGRVAVALGIVIVLLIYINRHAVDRFLHRAYKAVVEWMEKEQLIERVER